MKLSPHLGTATIKRQGTVEGINTLLLEYPNIQIRRNPEWFV